jgi:hypothetical protein
MLTDRGVVAATLALSILSLSAAWVIRQRAVAVPAEYIALDQIVYYAMARAPFADTPEVRHAPGSFRVFPALAARAIGELGGIGPERGFFVLTYVSLALFPIATVWFLLCFGSKPDVAVTGGAIAALLPPIVSYGSWAVANVDVIGVLLLTVAATAVITARVTAFCVTVFVLSLTKESALIAVWFALVWGVLVDRRLLVPAVATLLFTLLVRSVVLPRLIPPAPEYPYGTLSGFYGAVDSLSLRYVGRRVLLGSAATFNAVLPFAAAALVRERATPRGIALWTTIGVAAAQMGFASDSQRVVAAGAPFVLAACALELDRQPDDRRWKIGAALVACQLPWLLEYGRLVHIPAIRSIEIVLFLITAVVVFRTWRAHPHPLWPSVVAQS